MGSSEHAERAAMIALVLQMALFEKLGTRLATLTLDQVNAMTARGEIELEVAKATGKDMLGAVDAVVDAMIGALDE